MFQIFRFKTIVHADLKLSTYADIRTVPEPEYKGIVNEVLVMSDESAARRMQPEARVRIARRVDGAGAVQVYEIGARSLVAHAEADWPALRSALASFALGRMALLLAAAGITMPAVVLGEAQAISDRTAAMLLGVPTRPESEAESGEIKPKQNPEA